MAEEKKPKVIARLYAVVINGTVELITAASARDLGAAVQRLTGDRQAGLFARLVWDGGNRYTDTPYGNLRIVYYGELLRETWRKPPQPRATAAGDGEQPGEPESPVSATWEETPELEDDFREDGDGEDTSPLYR